ncbi:MAG TPA: TIM-barrel domain-containing protein [Streptosporangiaceae bacterium]|nr:TIM-barrel domain-containing protein [Streptosporangiaceae bacterium]
MLPLQSLIRARQQVGDLPSAPDAPAGPPAALTSARVASARPGRATFTGPASDGEPLTVQVTAVMAGVLRVSLSRDGSQRPRSETALPLVRDPGRASDAAGAGGTAGAGAPAPAEVRVSAGDLVAVISPDPWSLRFEDGGGRTLLAQQHDDVDVTGEPCSLPFGGTALADGELVYHASFEARPDEQYYGLGERFGTFGKRGTRTVAWIEDALGVSGPHVYKAVPYFWSTRGYGLLVNSGAPAEIDLAHTSHSTVSVVVPDEMLEFYVIRAAGPEDALAPLRALTGDVPLPPRWAFGTWVSSSFQPDTQESVLERARRIRRDGFPADVLHVDPYWQRPGCWSDLAWDRDTFPDPRALTAELRELGFRLCLWINSYISVNSPRFAEASAAGYFLRRADGSTWTGPAWGESEGLPEMAIVDFTNPAAVRWWQGLLTGLLEDGVAVFKTDFAEAVPPGTVAWNGASGRDLHNVYTLLYNDAVADVTEQVHGYRLVWGRSSFLGGQRNAAQWGGDPASTYGGMGSTLRGGLSYAISGGTFWSHDVGGFYGSPSPGLYLRWAWFGALSPLNRYHGNTSRLPWDQAGGVYAATQQIVATRYRLLPYLYSAAAEAVRQHRTWLRPVIAAAPHDRAARDADGEYLIGTDLLAAPVTAADGEQDVYLPAGTWVDYASHASFDGGRWHRLTRPPEQAPLFVRHGALLPVDADGAASAAADPAALALEVWGGTGGATTVHEDRGETRIALTVSGGAAEITVTGPAPLARVEWPRIPGQDPPGRVAVNGQPWTMNDQHPDRMVAVPAG